MTLKKVGFKVTGSGVQVLKLSVGGVVIAQLGNEASCELAAGRHRLYFNVIGPDGADFEIALKGARCVTYCGGGAPAAVHGEIGDDGDCRGIAYVEVGT